LQPIAFYKVYFLEEFSKEPVFVEGGWRGTSIRNQNTDFATFWDLSLLSFAKTKVPDPRI
jgi:hypothetical protein